MHRHATHLQRQRRACVPPGAPAVAPALRCISPGAPPRLQNHSSAACSAEGCVHLRGTRIWLRGILAWLGWAHAPCSCTPTTSAVCRARGSAASDAAAATGQQGPRGSGSAARRQAAGGAYGGRCSCNSYSLPTVPANKQQPCFLLRASSKWQHHQIHGRSAVNAPPRSPAALRLQADLAPPALAPHACRQVSDRPAALSAFGVLV